MNTYELTILFPDPASSRDSAGTGVEKEKARVLKVVADFVKKSKGEINKQDSWGVKKMAYQINKMDSADYEHMVITLEPSAQVELDKVLRLEENLLRYMFVRV